MSQTKFQEPFRPVLLNLTVKTIEELDLRADCLGWTRSDLMRQLLDRGLHKTNSAKSQTRAIGTKVETYNRNQIMEEQQ